MKHVIFSAFTVAVLVSGSQAFAQAAAQGGAGAGAGAPCVAGAGVNCPPAGASGGAGATVTAPGGGNGALQTQPGSAIDPVQGGAQAQGNAGANANQPKAPAQGTAQGSAGAGAGNNQPDNQKNTAQGNAGGGAGNNSKDTNVAVNITADQRTKVRQLIVAEKPAPVTNVTFNIVVGAVVPQTVTLTACPVTVLDLVTDLRPIGCRFFVLADGRIVIVRPDTLAVVLVVAA